MPVGSVRPRAKASRPSAGAREDSSSAIHLVDRDASPPAAVPNIEPIFRTVFEHAAVGLCIVDEDGRIVEVNEAEARFLGRSRQELRGRPESRLVVPEDAALDRALRKDLFAGRKRHYGVVKRFVRKDGSVVRVRLEVSIASDGDGRPYLIMARRPGAGDEADRQIRHASAEIARKNAALRQLIEQVRKEKDRCEEVIRFNLKHSIFPVLAGLKPLFKGAAGGRITLLETNLRNMMSSLHWSMESAGVLTRREGEIARLVAAGHSSKDIARMLTVSVRTVETHRDRIRRKMRLKSRRARLDAELAKMERSSRGSSR